MPRLSIKHIAKRLVRALVAFSCVVLVIGFLVFVMVFSTRPFDISSPQLSSDLARSGTRFATRVSTQVLNTRKPVRILGTQTELNSAFVLANKTHSALTGDVVIGDEIADFRLSVRLNILGMTRYINSEARLIPSDTGIYWTEACIGKIPLSDRAANWIFKRTVQAALGKRYGQRLLNSVQDVQIQHQQLEVGFEPPKGFQKGFAQAMHRLTTYSGKPIVFDTARIQHYLDFLVGFTRAHPKEPTSLSLYLQVLISEAKHQSQRYKLDSHHENLAALYALAIQISPGAFRHFVADLKVHRLNATPTPKLTLASRTDLAKHFVISIALKILSDKGVSFSIGEMKEIVDSNNGSGFSFTDIAADRAGISFAELATYNKFSAQLLQEYSHVGIRESDFFPKINHLPEGLGEKEFKRRFINTKSVPYLAMLEHIDRRIKATPLLAAQP